VTGGSVVVIVVVIVDVTVTGGAARTEGIYAIPAARIAGSNSMVATGDDRRIKSERFQSDSRLVRPRRWGI
jgi:hypothetical protein